MRHEVLGAGAGLMESAGLRAVVHSEKGSSIVMRETGTLSYHGEQSMNQSTP